MENEIKVTTEMVNEVEEVAKAFNWKSFGKGITIVGGAAAATYFIGKYAIKPVVKKFFNKDTEELETYDGEEIEVTELASEYEE